MRRRILLIFSLFIAIIAKADIEPAENQIWWGYFADSDASGLSLDDGYLGNGSACTLDAAIRVPANDDFVGGSTIKAIRFWLANDISGIKTMRIWIATKKPTGATTTSAYRQTVLKSNLVGGLNEIELNTPFEVNNREIYVGYTITTSKKCYPIMGGGTTVPDGFFYRIGTGTSTNVTYGSWYDFYADGYDYGKLALQLAVAVNTERSIFLAVRLPRLCSFSVKNIVCADVDHLAVKLFASLRNIFCAFGIHSVNLSFVLLIFCGVNSRPCGAVYHRVRIYACQLSSYRLTVCNIKLLIRRSYNSAAVICSFIFIRNIAAHRFMAAADQFIYNIMSKLSADSGYKYLHV